MKIQQDPVKPARMEMIPLLSAMFLVLAACSWALSYAAQERVPEIPVEVVSPSAFETQVSCSFSSAPSETAAQ